MYVFKGFAANSLYTNNAANVVSVIGELSALSMTYARDRGLYRSNLSNTISLTAFKSDIAGTPYVATADLIDDIISIVKRVYDNAGAGAVTQNAFLQDLLVQFGTIAQNFSCGAFVTDNGKFVPEYIAFESKNIANIGAGNLIKIWLVDGAFQTQYDEYELVIVPPLANLDVFFTGANAITAALAAIKQDQITAGVQTARAGKPETLQVTKLFDYNDPVTPNLKISTQWNVLIYGIAGNNDIIIQNAMITYILANSNHAQNAWSPLFPDIFKHTEFTIIPKWTDYAIPNQQLQAGIYSPMECMQDVLNQLTNWINAYPSIHIAANACIFSQPYKSLTITAVGSPDNKNALFKIKDVFPDFIDVSSTSSDFSRMSQATQDWARMLAQMIFTAETMNVNSSVPAGMSKVTRNNILYLVSRFQNIDYLVAAKGSF